MSYQEPGKLLIRTSAIQTTFTIGEGKEGIVKQCIRILKSCKNIAPDTK